MVSLYCSDCTVNLHENFISILGDMPTMKEFPTDANFLNWLLYLSSFEIQTKRMDLPFMSRE